MDDVDWSGGLGDIDCCGDMDGAATWSGFGPSDHPLRAVPHGEATLATQGDLASSPGCDYATGLCVVAF